MEVTVQQVETFVQDAFNNVVKSGNLTQKQIANLEEKLALAAFNMCAAGIESFVDFERLASWFSHLRAENHGQSSRMRGEIPKERPLDRDELAKALVLAEQAEIAGLLETEGELYRFVYLEVQAYFAALYISLNLKDYELLERAEGFKTHEVWQFLAYLDPSLENRLLKELQNRDSYHRALAAKGLGRMCSQRAVPLLMQALDELDEKLQSRAAEALAEIGDPAAIPALASLIRYSMSENFQHSIVNSLAKFGEPAVPELLALIDANKHPLYKMAITSSLGRMNETLRDPQLELRVKVEMDKLMADFAKMT